MAFAFAPPPAPEAALFGTVLLGFSCCFALPILLMAGLIYAGKLQWGGLRRMITSARPTAVADLPAARTAVRVSGRVAAVPDPVLFEGVPCAFVRLQVDGMKWSEVQERQALVGIEGGKVARDFWLEDSTGRVWVEPQPVDSRLLGPGEQASVAQAREATDLLGLTGEGASMMEGGGASGKLWRWPVGTALTVLGQVEMRGAVPVLVRPSKLGLPVSPLDEAGMVAAAGKAMGTGALALWVLFLIGACFSGSFLLGALSFFVKALRG